MVVKRLQKMVTTAARGYRYVDGLHSELMSMHLHTVRHDKASKTMDDGQQYFEETRSVFMYNLWLQHRLYEATGVDRSDKRL